MRYLTLAFALLLASHGAAANQSPNLVFLLVDDLRWNALGCMGDKVVKTPHIDQLAADGTLFKNAFVTTSICSVSRASIFTGQWMRRHGIEDFKTGLTTQQWASSYPRLLKDAGYRLGFVGKFGVGSAEELQLKTPEFDFWKGQPGQGTKLFIDPADPTKTHTTARYGNESLEFLKTCSSSQPFSLSVSFSAVHARDKQPREFQPDPQDEELYIDEHIPVSELANEKAFEKIPDFVQTSEGRTRWGWRFDTEEKTQSILKDYYRLITGVDREVGRIREVLKERGLEDNTVIILTADNGYALGDRGLADKWFMWEEDIRVAAMIYDPRIPAEKRVKEVQQMTLNVDFAPTMIAMAGVKIPEVVQGRSLEPLLTVEQTPENWRTEFFYEHHSVPERIPQVEGVRTARWKYIRWVRSEPLVEELYDLQADPLEQQNLIADERQLETLTQLREKWKTYGETLR